MNRQAYISPTDLADLRLQLSVNEWAVLEDLAVMRIARATDLQRLQALRSPLSVRQFRRLLASLTERQVLQRLERSIGGKRSGSAGFVYVVGPAGRRLRALDGDTQRHYGWTPRTSWLKHALAASQLYVLLREAEASASLRLVAFESEPTAWRSFPADDGTVVLKPDAYVVMERGEYLDSYFVEVDCGTESPTTLKRKCEVYAQYWRAGVEQAAHGVFPQVLWLVPNQRRLDVVRGVIQRQGDASQLHQAELYADVRLLLNEEPP